MFNMASKGKVLLHALVKKSFVFIATFSFVVSLYLLALPNINVDELKEIYTDSGADQRDDYVGKNKYDSKPLTTGDLDGVMQRKKKGDFGVSAIDGKLKGMKETRFRDEMNPLQTSRYENEELGNLKNKAKTGKEKGKKYRYSAILEGFEKPKRMKKILKHHKVNENMINRFNKPLIFNNDYDFPEPFFDLPKEKRTNNKSVLDGNDLHNKTEKRTDFKYGNSTKVSQFRTNCSRAELKVLNPFDLKCKIPFLEDYKNPCWNENGEIRCLPYFMIIGMMKSGTTDLYNRLLVHPRIISPSNKRWQVEEPKVRVDQTERKWKSKRWADKEIHWWSQMFVNNKTINDYVDHFKSASRWIASQLTTDSAKGKRIHNAVTVDSSTSTSWGSIYWQKDWRNLHLSEPKYIVPHYIKQLLPNEKIIILLRNPTDRLYSEYLFFRKLLSKFEKSPAAFHKFVEEAIVYWNKCLEKYHLRKCLYKEPTKKIHGTVSRGLYIHYLRDWLTVFPASQVAIILFEDYVKDPLDKIKKTFKFLNLDALPKQLEKELKSLPVENKADKKHSPMLSKTRELLNFFYKDSMEELAKYLRIDNLWGIGSVTLKKKKVHKSLL